jgi:hypothetical protein
METITITEENYKLIGSMARPYYVIGKSYNVIEKHESYLIVCAEDSYNGYLNDCDWKNFHLSSLIDIEDYED